MAKGRRPGGIGWRRPLLLSESGWPCRRRPASAWHATSYGTLPGGPGQ